MVPNMNTFSQQKYLGYCLIFLTLTLPWRVKKGDVVAMSNAR
jgi:hypothetical protein